MKRQLHAIALCLGSLFLATACGSSGGGSSNPGCVQYGSTCYTTCTPPTGAIPGEQYGLINGVCEPMSGVNGLGGIGGYGYGSCTSCMTPNGQPGVLLNFDGVPTCGLSIGGAGYGMIGGQMYACYGSSIGGYPYGGYSYGGYSYGGYTTGYPYGYNGYSNGYPYGYYKAK